jgi:hypothetical protein
LDVKAAIIAHDIYPTIHPLIFTKPEPDVFANFKWQGLP